MRVLSCLLPAALALAALVHSRPGQACGASYPAYLTLTETWPATGATGVALDAPVLIRGTSWPKKGQKIGDFNLSQKVQVEVRAAGSTALVECKTHDFNGTVAWNPDAPLAPSTTYELTIHVDNEEPVPADATGPIDLQSTFTTGASPLAPLAFVGEPTYAFDTREHSYCPAASMNPCGQCSEPLTRPGWTAVVTLPAITGGAEQGGYHRMAWLENGAGIPVGTVKIGSALRPNDPATVIELPIPEEEAPYELCLHVELSDATGRGVATETRCFPEETSVGTAGANGGGGNNSAGTSSAAGSGTAGSGTAGSGTAGSQTLPTLTVDDPTTPDSNGSSDGCSTSGRQAGRGLGLAVLAGVSLLTRRRRSTR